MQTKLRGTVSANKMHTDFTRSQMKIHTANFCINYRQQIFLIIPQILNEKSTASQLKDAHTQKDRQDKNIMHLADSKMDSRGIKGLPKNFAINFYNSSHKFPGDHISDNKTTPV